MGPRKKTTRDLFRTIGNTERTRSAKADSVFRQLRKGQITANNDEPKNTDLHEQTYFNASANASFKAIVR